LGSSAVGVAPGRCGWRTDRSALAAWGLALLAFVLVTAVAIRQHATFHTRARDMGIYAQVVWNTGHGRPFTSTLLEDNRLHIAEHVAPLLALAAPFYALLPDPRLLLVFQQAALAAARPTQAPPLARVSSRITTATRTAVATPMRRAFQAGARGRVKRAPALLGSARGEPVTLLAAGVGVRRSTGSAWVRAWRLAALAEQRTPSLRDRVRWLVRS
jgi:hypothetical protein